MSKQLEFNWELDAVMERLRQASAMVEDYLKEHPEELEGKTEEQVVGLKRDLLLRFYLEQWENQPQSEKREIFPHNPERERQKNLEFGINYGTRPQEDQPAG
jgi:hypothetical protein